MMYYGEGRVLPQAAVVQVFGKNGTMQASIAAILHENGIQEAFPEDAQQQAGSLGDRVPADAYAGRRDLRDELIFTIDGDSAKDFDDAVSLKSLANGRVQLGVHIADVSHYVTPDSPLDAEAYRRGTSVYYPRPRGAHAAVCLVRTGCARSCQGRTGWPFRPSSRLGRMAVATRLSLPNRSSAPRHA